ncbi:MAG TPA: 2-oxoglutarate dehydrogenase, E2 component, dihydrolipoamide succinyltransferase [Ignavibacteriaceae bacterium]|nr:2-oxoglutarate dehydrogenase, E2 component, dihydrolipoamide succinyltransferase [Ignavibacteriaceae bacterium]
MDVIMPKMGESISEGTILKWHKKEGDKVSRDEIIFEISTDKVDTEIPSPAEGILSNIKYKEGDTIEVGTVVAEIKENAESLKKREEENKNREAEPEMPAADKENGKQKIKERQSSESYEGKKDEVEIIMPKMGESVMEGTIIKWYKKVGDEVKKDETLFEISTDKVDTEVPSPSSGILSEIIVKEQETVEVGTVLGKISSNGGKKRPAVTEEAKEKKKEDIKEETVNLQKEDKKELTGNKKSSFISPLVFNIAEKENVSNEELRRIAGTGIEGRVTKKDILSYVEEKKKQPVKNNQSERAKEKPPREEIKRAPSFEMPEEEVVYSSKDIEKIEMDNIRQKIMQHMIKSRDTAVHVSAMLEVDMTKIHNFIQAHREEYLKSDAVKLTYMAFIAHAAVKGLKEYPLLNASIEGTTIIRKKYINLGIAVAIEPTGLIVPNIKNAGEKNIIGFAKAINDLAYKARNKKLIPDDISNGTFSITNYGVFGTIFGTPIINQPEVAILGVGAVIKKPVVIEFDGIDTIAVKPVMTLTLSHDHRLVDGMLGGKFLKFIKEFLENFDENLI